MKNRFVSALVLATIVHLSLGLPAQAKTVTDGTESFPTTFDIKSATLTKPKAHTLAWTMRSWDSWTDKDLQTVTVNLFVDVRDTEKADYRIEVFYYQGLDCKVQTPSGHFVRWGNLTVSSNSTLRCVFSTQGFAPTKLIHWRTEKDGFGTDKAPNSGWLIGVG